MTYSNFSDDFKAAWRNSVGSKEKLNLPGPEALSLGYAFGKVTAGACYIICFPIGWAIGLCVFAVPVGIVYVLFKGIDFGLGDLLWFGVKLVIRLPTMVFAAIIPIGIAEAVGDGRGPVLKLIVHLLGWVAALIAAILTWKSIGWLGHALFGW